MIFLNLRGLTMDKRFINTTVFKGYQNKVASKLYGLLCEREKNGNWEDFLKNIHIEVLGLMNIVQSIHYWELLAKVGALRWLNYKAFRETIFNCIELVKELELKDFGSSDA